jgi:hypothetical protein
VARYRYVYLMEIKYRSIYNNNERARASPNF